MSLSTLNLFVLKYLRIISNLNQKLKKLFVIGSKYQKKSLKNKLLIYIYFHYNIFCYKK